MSSLNHKLIAGWREVSFNSAPYFFPGDEFLEDSRCGQHVVVIRSFKEFINSKYFGSREDRTLHLGRLPVPHIGYLDNASIFILMLNPGLGPHDYYFEEKNIENYKSTLVRNIRQENQNDEYPFMFLDPKYVVHGGFVYWESKLRDIAVALQRKNNIDYKGALKILAKKIACIEYMPYSSYSFGIPNNIMNQLASSKATLDYVRNILVERAKKGKALIIVTRQVRRWNLPHNRNIIEYDGPEARSAHLTIGSKGGNAIAERLGLL